MRRFSSIFVLLALCLSSVSHAEPTPDYLAQAQTAIDQGRFLKAERALLRALYQDRPNEFALVKLSELYLLQRRFDESMKIGSRALIDFPEQPDIWRIRALIHGHFREDQNAHDAFQRALNSSTEPSFILIEQALEFYTSRENEQEINKLKEMKRALK